MTAVAYAVVHTEPAAIYVATDIDVLQRVIAVEVIAKTDHRLLAERSDEIRDALLTERWAAAAAAWIEATGIGIDVYTNISVYDGDDLPSELIGAQLQFTPLFRG
ncbi:MAG: hypothetical protein OEX04_18585 [Acidimicrobiia bacterium]|nr:hypothetical protein [Acidimicrobiia bacterium]MDH5292818.1 hypothetical protein [Acidimicrobiia bacterium]